MNVVIVKYFYKRNLLLVAKLEASNMQYLYLGI